MLVSALLLVVLTACQSADDKEPEEIKEPVNKSMELENEESILAVLVKEGEYENFLEIYEQDLVDDDWEVTLDEKPIS